MQSREQAYQQAASQSYGGNLMALRIPFKKKTFEPVHLSIGIQPHGICSLGDDCFALTDYFNPAIYIGKMARGQTVEMDVIRHVLYSGQSCRIFPFDAQPGGANRVQTVNVGPNGTLIVSANASRSFCVLVPPIKPGGEWVCVRQFDLPHYPSGDYQSVFSAYFGEDKVLVTTAPGDLDQPWELGVYLFKPYRQLEYVSHRQLPMSYVYGIAFRPDDPEPWFIVDSRSSGQPGLYRGDHLVIPNVSGNGLCFVRNGSALISRYGQELRHKGNRRRSFGGNPGGLIFIQNTVVDRALDKLDI